MPLTPADVHNVAFSKPPIGKPGYHEHEVDAFIDLIEAELARLIEDNHELCNQLEKLDQRAHAAPIDTAASPHPVGPAQPGMAPVPPPTRKPVWAGEDPNGHAARVLGMAQQMANQLASQAQAEADTMLNGARLSAEQLLAEAQAKAQGRVTEARTRAETMLEDARARAETLEQQSRDKAAAQQHQAAHQHTEIITALTEEKNALENGIKQLRVFERAYRASVVSYVQSQLHELSGHQPPEPSKPEAGPTGLGNLPVGRS